MVMSCVNSDNLLGVALVINRSRDGPAFVFHYPEHVQPIAVGAGQQNSVDLEDILLERLAQPASRNAFGGSDGEQASRAWDHDEHVITEAGSHVVPWDIVAGFPARDLASVLTPARAYHKTLFQLSLDPLYCVSYPIHVPENGKWKKSKKASRADTARSTDEHVATNDSDGNINKSHKPNQDKDGKKNDGGDDDSKRSSMTMFNLVFLLNPKKFEVKELVDSLYVNFVKKANKAYKYSQQRSDFVWKESKRILAAKDKGREDQKKMSVLWKEIISNSSLAASMLEIYEAASQNRIATLHLETAGGVLSPSFQIPVPFHIADLPEHSDQSQHGLWLSTANAFLSQDALEEPGFLDRNFALLLMDDEKKIISELQQDPDPATMSMVEFVRLSKPTMSFHQVAQSNVLTLSQVRKFAQHFIFWRRAMAIPPLHARDVYIVSPNCDVGRLSQDSQEWQRLFPVAPPLSNFLGELSQAPRSYKHLCPSKAHRPTYLLMLAWLIRRGWVTQLCTFAYVLVWPEIIYEVDYAIEAEELGQAREQSSVSSLREMAENQPSSSVTNTAEGSQSAQGLLQPSPTGTETTAAVPIATVEESAEQARLERIATKAQREATEKAITHNRRVIPTATAHPSLNDAPHLKGLTPHIILDAKKATGKESRYLSAIAERFKDPKLKSAWQNFCKYFDGRSALERVALQEDMKRKEAWNLLTSMTEYLMTTRHW